MSIDYDSNTTGGCPTCGCGSVHCYNVNFQFDNKPRIFISADEDENNIKYVDEAELITLLLRNFMDIVNMTYDDFRTFLSRHFHVYDIK